MQAPQIAIYALLAGCEKAKKDLGVAQSDVESALQDLSRQNSRFITKIRQTLMEKGMKDNTKNTAKAYNVPEFLIIEMLRKYLNEEANQPGNTFYPFDTFDRFTQTFELPVKNWMHVASQTDLPYKTSKKSYSTQEKIEEIRKSLRNEASAPSNLIEKWKEKISKKLFQESHTSQYTDGKKDRFFNDVDGLVLEWCRTQNDLDEEELKKKCIEIVFYDNCSLKIQDSWVKAFKLFHSLG